MGEVPADVVVPVAVVPVPVDVVPVAPVLVPEVAPEKKQIKTIHFEIKRKIDKKKRCFIGPKIKNVGVKNIPYRQK